VPFDDYEDPKSPEEIKQAIRARREAISIMGNEIQILTDQLHKKIGPEALIQFMAEFTRGD
jgi:hypothetical protein